MAVSTHTVVVGGLPVHVFSNGALEDVSGSVAVLFFLHGRMGSAAQVTPVVEGLFRKLGEIETAAQGAKKQLVVATIVSPVLVYLCPAGC